MYLVTHSDDYYPGPGVADWVLLTCDPIEADNCFADIFDHYGTGNAYLIALHERDGKAIYSVLEHKSYDHHDKEF
jgi:hypothetical protein